MISKSEPPSTAKIYTADTAVTAETLKGIGISKAIITYQEAYGVFQLIEEFEAVKGIGKSTIERMKD